MRPLNLVLEAIRKVISQSDFENKSHIFSELLLIESRCNYSDVYQNSALWAETSVVLREILGEVDTDWKRKVEDLYSGKENYINYI